MKTGSIPSVSREFHRSFFITRVYSWMFIALVVTGVTAHLTASFPQWTTGIEKDPDKLIYLVIGEIFLAVYLDTVLDKISFWLGGVMFFVFSVFNGIVFSFIFLIFNLPSISVAFFVAAGLFGGMGIYGWYAKRDLGKKRNLVLMGLCGLVLTGLVNIFFFDTVFYWVTTYAGVLIFVSLTALIARRLRDMGDAINEEGSEGGKRALYGALMLYLSFINLFLLIIRFFGNQEDEEGLE